MADLTSNDFISSLNTKINLNENDKKDIGKRGLQWGCKVKDVRALH